VRIPPRPHLLGIDDGPFEKFVDERVPLVGVMMEGADRIEGVATTSFPVDGTGVAEFLAEWVGALRCRAALHGVVLGGITIAGLAVVDVALLSDRLGLPVLVVNRRDPEKTRLREALEAAGVPERWALVERAPAAVRVGDGLYLAAAGVERDAAMALVRAALAKSRVPEPLRVAHLIAHALVRGESRGRV